MVYGLLHFLLLATAWAAEDIRGKHHRRHTVREEHQEGDQKHERQHAKRQYGQQPQWFGAGPAAYPTGYYDYIVIGSGAGGGVVAPRLARYGYSVLLIEAGDDQGNDLNVKVPALQLQSTELITQRCE
ncbi:hypothetical protein HII31_11477 [Pseudocercospora fuligena]|uniref:Glucose-methanol-choline oxidoreductase N-terminal domain-containing protein n=1 Tax=Pseudocercospora fuligena TaxID=685502 RepID=A0A8H6RB67_9PEZI|nr:hypothetical protein HII31_11477 [Pseudocercospora fuligena]